MADNTEGPANSRPEIPARPGVAPPLAPEPWQPQRQYLGDWRCGGHGGLHGGARYEHRQCRPALHGGQPGREQRREHLDPHFLPGFECHRAAHQRMVRRRARPQAILHDVSRDLHGEFPAVRDCAQPRGDYPVSRAAGRGRGRTATHGPGHPGRHFSTSTARRGLRALWHHHHRRAYDRTDLGRLDYRQLYLALDFLHQPAGGHHGACFWFIA